MQTEQVDFSETVEVLGATRLFSRLLALPFVAALPVGVFLLIVVPSFGVAIALAVLVSVAYFLWTFPGRFGVTVTVGDGVMGVRQWRLRRSVQVAEIALAEAARGRWWMDYSLRYGFGTRCFLAPGAKLGVELVLEDGRHFFVSTRRPDELLSTLRT